MRGRHLCVILLTSMLALMLAGCGPGMGAEVNSEETGDAEPGSWVEMRCIEGRSGAVCLGLPLDADDAWVHVVSACRLDAMIDAGEAVELDAWADGCAAGQHPAGFMPAWRCVWVVDHGASACFVGDGSWWAQVSPACAAPALPDAAWSPSACGGLAGQTAAAPWDSIACTGDGVCLGEASGSTMLVSPGCWVAEQAQAEQPAC